MTLEELYEALGGVRILGQTDNGKLQTEADTAWLINVWVMCHEYSNTEGRDIFMDYIKIQFQDDTAMVSLIENLVACIALR